MSLSVDQILQRMIVDARNYNPSIAISQGTETYIRFATAASAIWGLYKQKDWTVDQIFPTTMSRESLERFASDRGKSSEGLTSAELLSYMLSVLRNPASGGRPTDFERWSMEASSNGKAAVLTAENIAYESNMPRLDASAIVQPHNYSIETGIAFTCSSSDVGKSVIIDLLEAKPIIGMGVGFLTVRKASFKVLSTDNLEEEWTERGTIDSKYWWAQAEFEEVSARYWKCQLEFVEELQSFQTEELNEVKSFGIELYEPSETPEKADLATCLSNYYGIGTVLMLVSPTSLSMRCCEAIRAKCEYEGPVAPREIWVNVPKETALHIKADINGLDALDAEQFRADVSRYFAEMQAGNLFIPSQIVVFAIKNGAQDATIELSYNGQDWVSATTKTPDTDEKFVLGSLVVV